MNIIFNEDYLPNHEIMSIMKKAGELCLMEENVKYEDADIEISVSFVSPEEIKELNRIYRNKDAETDVLSFPQYNSIKEIQEEKGFVCLGDVVISADTAGLQAEEYGHTVERELVYLLVHSMLHLLGYDHMENQDKVLMREKEEKVMNLLGLSR